MITWAGTFCVVLMVAAIGLASSAQAQVTAVGAQVGSPVDVCIARVATRDTSGKAVAQRPHFTCDNRQRSRGPGNFWVISQPLAVTSSPSNPLRIRFASLWQDRVTLYARYADGHVAVVSLDAMAIARHIQLGAIVEIPLSHRDAALTRLLWRVDGSANMRGVVLGARIATASESALSNQILAALYGGFVGLGLALLVYNIALWGALRYRFQLVYCAMVVCLMVYAWTSSGAFAWMVPGLSNNLRMTLNYLGLCWSGAAALAFSRSYFEAHVFSKRLSRLTTAAILLLLSVGLSLPLFGRYMIGVFDVIYSVSFLAMFVVLSWTLWSAARRRSNYLWLFGLAWAAPITMAVARAVHNIGLIPWSFWLDNSTLMAMTAEALLTSVAIAYRIRLIGRERDEARALEVVARELADVDPLTGLLNRRAFLTHAIGRSDNQLLTLIDIDHFKRVNDTIGHDGGDEVLRVFARTLRQASSTGALVARLGGEEFAILTPISDAQQPDHILMHIRTARMPFDMTVTASIGCCSGPINVETEWKRLYNYADRALFEAKSAGRDRARIARNLAEAA